jgi:hypothetical protein
MAGDWVFASPRMRGGQPYRPGNIMKRHTRPLASEAGIHKNIGWHTIRHYAGFHRQRNRNACSAALFEKRGGLFEPALSIVQLNPKLQRIST